MSGRHTFSTQFTFGGNVVEHSVTLNDSDWEEGNPPPLSSSFSRMSTQPSNRIAARSHSDDRLQWEDDDDDDLETEETEQPIDSDYWENLERGLSRDSSGGVTHLNGRQEWMDSNSSVSRMSVHQTNTVTTGSSSHVSSEWWGEVPFEVLKHATNNFSRQKNRVYKGCDYEMFKGNIDQRDVAVKIYNSCELLTVELDTLSLVSDCPNIIKMLGYCNYNPRDRSMAVFEFVPNGSLHDHLHGNRRPPLKWSDRKKIAIGIGEALKSLQQTTNGLVIHGRIDSKNILLDHDFVPKVSNFHYAEVLESGITELETKRDYVDPAFTVTISEKIDVYSFGILLLELITGRVALARDVLLAEWAFKVINEDGSSINSYIDTKLNGECIRSELDQLITLAENCLYFDPIRRPTAKQIVEALEGKICLVGTWNNENDRIRGGSEAGPSLPAPESRISNFEQNYFTFKELADATESFNQRFILGEGGFGSVYKATLLGKTVAIKKLFYCELQGKQFESEISVLAKLKHPNLVNMLGYCCDEDNNRLIVLEFMPKKSLASHLHVDFNKPVLDWSKRMMIALGAAKGIAFLHVPRDQGKIIHRDIKPENILLGEDFEPKIADFGLARFMSYKKSHISTDSYATSGYVAPECKRYGHVTDKSDVFSFGILLLEFVTGKEQIFVENGEKIYLSKWAVDKLKYAVRTENFINIVDVKLKKKYDKEQMGRMIYCAVASIYKHEKSRPTMSQIADVLEGKMKKELIWNPSANEDYLRDPYEA